LINNIEYSDPSNINNTSNGLITIQQPANYVFAAKGRIGINCINQQNDARLGLSTLRVGFFGTSVTQEVTFNGMPANTQIIDIQKGQTIYLDYDITTTPTNNTKRKPTFIFMQSLTLVVVRIILTAVRWHLI